MAKLFLAASMTWALCFSGTNCGTAKVQGPQTRELKAENEPAGPTLILTHEHPSNSFPVEPNALSNDTEVLEVRITKVVNLSGTPVVIFVYLSETGKGKSEPERILIGNFSLYPPDQPGTFLLNPAPAIHKLSAEKSSNDTGVRLVFEMKRLDESRPWTPVEVTISQPKWRAREK